MLDEPQSLTQSNNLLSEKLEEALDVMIFERTRRRVAITAKGRELVAQARKVLQELDANMLGIIVNGIDHRTGSYGYYSSYRRGYGYNYAYKYGYGQDQTEKALGKYFEEPAETSTDVRVGSSQ